MFFVATAPSGAAGRVNLSPKGYESLTVIGTRTLLFLDYPGSGNETANHVKENGRITFMWCSFGAKPLILRTYGVGRVVEKGSEEFTRLMAAHFPAVKVEITRQLLVQEIEAVQTSCGSGVPHYEYVGERRAMGQWAEGQAAKGTLEKYIEENASRSEEKFPIQR